LNSVKTAAQAADYSVVSAAYLRSPDIRSSARIELMLHLIWVVPGAYVAWRWPVATVAFIMLLAVAGRAAFRELHTRVRVTDQSVESWVSGHLELAADRATVTAVTVACRRTPKVISALASLGNVSPSVILRVSDGTTIELPGLTFGRWHDLGDPQSPPWMAAQQLADELGVACEGLPIALASDPVEAPGAGLGPAAA
jgi:hypothetical protein